MRLVVKTMQTRNKNYDTRVFKLVVLGIQSLEVEPVVGILQEGTVIFNEEICTLVETSMDDIRAIPHGIKFSFPYLIIGLVVDED